MTEHSADLSKLLSLDKTITSQLNWAVFFKKYHMQSQRQPCRSEFAVPSHFPSPSDERDAHVRD